MKSEQSWINKSETANPSEKITLTTESFNLGCKNKESCHCSCRINVLKAVPHGGQ